MQKEKKSQFTRSLRTTLTHKSTSGSSWSGKIIKGKSESKVEVNSISSLLKRCAAVSEG